jgi:hypothetical protein
MTHAKPTTATQGRVVTAKAPIAAPRLAKPLPGRPRASLMAKTRGPDVDAVLDRYGGD